MLSTILSLAILSASALDSPTWSAICRVWSIAASNALRAISLCLARTCCGSPLGLKLRAMTSATLAASIISFCLVVNDFIPSDARSTVCVNASKFLRCVSTSLSTSTFGIPRSDPNCRMMSTNECDSFVMFSSRVWPTVRPCAAVRHAALVQPQSMRPWLCGRHRRPARQGEKRPSITWGVLRIGLVAADQESGMKWRILVELAGADGSVQSHEISVGGCGTIDSSAETLGLTLAEGKKTLAGLQRHLVQAQTEEHCRNRRRCQRCGAQRPLKDIRRRRLTSLFGVVEVRAPRFGPCRCGVASHRTITPAAEIMPD